MQKGKTVVEAAPPPPRRKSGSHAAATPSAPRPSAEHAPNKTAFHSAESIAQMTGAGARTKLVGWLVSFTKDPTGHDIQLREGRNVIGSDSRCDIYIHNDRSISGNHAIIMCRDGAVYLRDNDSMNGTYVDDVDIFGKGSVELKDRSRVRFGDSHFTIYLM